MAGLDRFQRAHGWLAIPIAVIRKNSYDNGGNLAAVLAFYGFFSIFPLLLVFVTILGFVLAGDQSALHSVEDSVLGSFPVIGDSIQSESLTGSVPALVIGVLLTLWSGLGVTGTVRHALDVVWDVPRKERAGWISSKIRGLALLAALGLMFVIASGASGLVTGGLTGVFVSIAGIAVSMVLNFCLFIVSFKVVCSADLRWRILAPGAAFAAVFWTIMQLIGGDYIQHIKNSNSAYGTFALVLGILAWLRIGAEITVYGAELNSILAKKLWPWPLSGADVPAAMMAASAEAPPAGEVAPDPARATTSD